MSAGQPPLSSSQKRVLLGELLRNRARQSDSTFPLSSGQEGLWFLYRSAPESTAYNIAFPFRICSAVDASAMRRAFQALMARHPLLRATFGECDGSPVQTVHGHCEAAFEVINASAWPRHAIVSRIAEFHRTPIDLELGPVMRMHLFTLGPEEHILLPCLHHIVHDGWALWMILDELGALYAAETGETPADLPPQRRTYASYVEWQQNMLASPEGACLWHYWRERLSGDLPVLNLPLDFPRRAIQTWAGASHSFRLDAELTGRLKELARSSGVTLFTLLLAAYDVLLYRYSGQEDILVGTPTSGRRQAEYAGVVGFFTDPVVVRADLSGNPGFLDFVQQIRTTVLDALDHQDIPLRALVEKLRLPRDPARSPLFQTSFVLQKPQRFADAIRLYTPLDPDARVSWGGMTLAPFHLPQVNAWFDLTVEMIEVPESLIGVLTWNSDLFRESTCVRMIEHFVRLLGAIVEAPATPISEFPLLSPAERLAAIQASRTVGAELVKGTTIHIWFDSIVALHPEHIAVTCGDESISYADLRRRADILAQHLRTRGVREEVLVGLCAERSIDLIVGILGILKAGGAYLPIDPAYPAERIRYLIEDSGIQLVVTQAALSGCLPVDVAGTILIDRLAEGNHTPNAYSASGAQPENCAYVIYTSGSTGRPKGVEVTHENVTRLFRATDEWFRFNPADVWTLFHSASFDFSVWEIWGALLYGGRLVIVPYEVSRDPSAFHELLVEEGITVLNQTPTAFRELIRVDGDLRDPRPLHLRFVIFGGELLMSQMLQPWIARHGDATPALINMYGITETTVHATFRRITAEDVNVARSPIGVAIPDLGVRVLDAHLEPVPFGVSGEVYVGGGGLARGYLGRPALTAERFVPDPYAAVPGARLYRSGDLARYLDNGELEYIGRADQQLKLRGFRVEPGEIEAVYRQHPGVSDCVVIARHTTDDRVRLVAYAVPDKTMAGPVLRQLALTAAGHLDPAHLYELPNGTVVAHLNRAETDFVYEEVFERETYLRHGICLPADACVFDVGANIGIFSLFVRQHAPNAKIFAFEPIPAVYECLNLNRELQGGDFLAFPIGLAHAEQTAEFHYYSNVSVVSGRYASLDEERDLIASYLRHQQPDISPTAISEMLTERLQRQSVVCRLRPLSALIREHAVETIDLLKIDVEKSELDVLRGIEDGDWPKIRQVVIEVHDTSGRLQTILNLLASHGFHTTVDQDAGLATTHLYNVYAIRERHTAPQETHPLKATQWQSAGTLARDLREFASGRLPDFMTPGAIVLLDSLPRNSNGKLNVNALPSPDAAFEPESDRTAARSPAEECFVGIWSEVLGIGKPGIHDNFFALGGDSILSLQIIARAAKAGFKISTRQMFQHQTIAELAAVATPATMAANTLAAVGGAIALTPIQAWFFEDCGPAPSWFNHSLPIELPVDATFEAVHSTLLALANHHDALRSRFTVADGVWRQDVGEPLHSIPLDVIDLLRMPEAKRDAAMQTAAASMQTRIDLSAGCLLNAIFFAKGANEPPLLLLTIHHLAVDGVSWRILLEDLSTLLAQGVLPAPTRSFQEWSTRLRSEAASPATAREISYWLSRRAPDMPAPERNTWGDALHLGVALSESATQALSSVVYGIANAQLHEALAASLTWAFHAVLGRDELLLNLEAHGRDEVFSDLDLSRTVGWFTAIYPVLLAFRSNAPDLLRHTKDMLRNVPRGGVGYGVLRYLSPDAELRQKLAEIPAAYVSFNHLGQLDQRLVKLIEGPGVPVFSPLTPRRHVYDVLSFVSNGVLNIRWTWPRAYQRSVVERLAGESLDWLGRMASAAVVNGAARQTPSDFPLARIDDQKLKKLSALLGKAKVN